VRGHGHSVGKAPTSHDVISRMVCLFTQLLGRRFHTMNDPDN
jgi:hypothetical protein